MSNALLGAGYSAVNKTGKFLTLQTLYSECLCRGKGGGHSKQIKNNTGHEEDKIRN